MALDWISRTCFDVIHQTNLVYNACWEDPRVDRAALDLSADDEVLVITSAGCNALDYVLAGAGRVHAVDMNPRQNALLELKLAAIRRLDFEHFFALFGLGRLKDWNCVYASQLRRELSPSAQNYWDRRGSDFFSGRGRRGSFYFHGSCGLFAYLGSRYINRVGRLRNVTRDLFAAQTVDEQREIYESQNVRETLFRPLLKWLLGRNATLAMLGVPPSQRRQLETGYPGGIVQFIIDRIETVFSRLPLCDNYFWRVYLTGHYSPNCCPEYLRYENFQKLKRELADRVSVHTDTLLGFLHRYRGRISRFVLLDHMDWLYANYPQLLAEEWQAIIDRAAPQARAIWRSAGFCVDFVDPLEVRTSRGITPVGDLLTYHRDLAETLHARDRVQTYGSFHVATIAAG
jgi:S-adenosylmethionine-diacylglycerol 3-amino-3-carboxypropyl transferase